MEFESGGFLLLLRITAVVEALYGIPFVLKRVPPNRFFGFKIQRLVPDEEAWYEANRIFGIGCAVAGVFTGIATFVMPYLDLSYDWGSRILLVFVVVLLPLFVVVGVTRNIMEERLKKR